MRPSVLTDYDGRDSLAHGSERFGVLEQTFVVVAVCINKTRSQDQPLRFYNDFVILFLQLTQCHDSLSPDAYVRHP